MKIMRTSEQASNIELVCDVLNHPALSLGSNTITPLLLPHSAREAGIHGFQFRTRGLEGQQTENLLLLADHQFEGAVGEVSALIADSTADRVLMACDRASLSTPPPAWGRLELLHSSQLFERLCAIPERLPKLIFAKARRDFNRTIYGERYQDRLLHVLHTPDGGDKCSHKEVPAKEFFRDWARADTKRHPVLLLGERGSGKTWQLLRFCQDIFQLHRTSPWAYGPPLFFDLREEGAHLGAFGSSVPLFPESVVREYPEASFLWDAKLIEALISTGHMPLCIDGFEEVSHIIEGNDGDAVDFLQRICSVISLRSRFIIACRATHFGSMEKFLRAEVWPNETVAGAFEVVSLVPFGRASVQAYLATVTDKAKDALEKILQSSAIFKPTDSPIYKGALLEALNICSTYPALLTSMVEKATSGSARLTDLLTAALVGAVVDYNIQMGKTTDLYRRSSGEVIRVGTKERVEMLGELVWHLAARGQDCVDMTDIPSRIVQYYGLELESIRTDIRTHTLLELPEVEDQGGADSPENDRMLDMYSSMDSSLTLRFAIRPSEALGSKYFPQRSHQEVGTDTDRATNLTADAFLVAPTGVTSVSGAFLLAKHVADWMECAAHLPLPRQNGQSAPVVDRLGAVGEVPLGLAAAGILRELLANISLGPAGQGPVALLNLSRQKIAECADRRDLSVFSPCFRYLGHNLEAMGLMSAAERAEIDPWWPGEVRKIERGPSRLPDYKMVIVSRPVNGAVPADFQREGVVPTAPGLGRPFLIGVGEVTNADYLRFVASDEGRDWRVEAMTVAGGNRNGSRSRFADFGNEYYLYFWEELAPSGSPSHLPRKTQLRHPVGYVSWFACGAFCDWLTNGDYPGESVYGNYFATDTAADKGSSDQIDFRAGYRLPSLLEWSWTARGGRLDVEFPWELYPQCLSKEDVDAWSLRRKTEVGSAAEDQSWHWLRKWRHAYREVSLHSSKDHCPVLSDPFGPAGTSGMMGNVKEWCHDPCGQDRDRRPILGATGFLGERSFAFDYGITLFPQNTNPDVGFRVCRPLSDGEISVLTRREAEIAHV